jgi:two-component system nitrogen regulation sensor histidine kinase NtrY
MAVTFADKGMQLVRQQVDWARRVGLERKLTIALLVAAFLSGIATYAALTGSFGAPSQDRATLVLLLIDLIVLLLLGTALARRLVALWMERRQGLAGARLHARMVLLFSVVAVTPTIVVAVFTTLFLNLGVNAWFSDEVSTAIKDSQHVAEVYLQEHSQHLGDQALAMVQNLRQQGLMLSRQDMEDILTAHSRWRDLSEAAIIDGHGQILANANYNILLAFDLDLQPWAFDKARSGQVVVLPSSTGDRVRALAQLDSTSDTFLYIGRLVDATALARLKSASNAARTYQDFEARRSGFQITFALIFVVMALLVLFAAIWFALVSASQLVRPIGQLADAAERVRSGDLSVRVNEGRADDEIGGLSRAFNRMTSQLDSQRSELIDANAQLDERRRFTELVLSGVSAGVIGLDDGGRIELPNRSACELLGVDLAACVGRRLAEVVPQMADLLSTGMSAVVRHAEAQITIEKAGSVRTLLVRVGAERGEGEAERYVVTFDDVTELLGAQRKAAWADVARRIAHEIKNPLTPIQLSAERLKRKYLKQIVDDKETFAVCTDTIVRQVSDIGRMVDEFSAFARMPTPVMMDEDVGALCRQAVFLQQSAHPQTTYHVSLPEGVVMLSCDAALMSRALNNLLQNAADAIEGRLGDNSGGLPGEIWLTVTRGTGQVTISVEDNGRGLPRTERSRLTEPYVTTRTKGTGLGLAIVKKIMEDHGGDLTLGDRPGGGAAVTLVFKTGTGAASGTPPLVRTRFS